IVSYAVVEFTGKNWAVQRSEHAYTATGTAETEAITSLNSLSHAFLYAQKRSGAGLSGVDEYGHEVWLSSIGAVSYYLEPGATNPSDQVSVAWVIENTETGTGEMSVTRSNGTSNGGASPLTLSVSIGSTLTNASNASIFINGRSSGTDTNYPRPIAGATIASTTAYELWRSETGSTLSYRTEIVEWPTANLSIHQDYYRFYVDANALTPTDPWPLGAADLGENAVLTSTDEPLGGGERVRIRMSLQAVGATLPASSRSFKLQYGLMTTTCSAIPEQNWQTVGGTSSSTAWRGYDAAGAADGSVLSGDPPTAGDLLLSVSDVAGSYEETNDTAVNSYAVPAGSDIEYDWLVEEHAASADSYYCFRMIESDGTPLTAYDNYPELKTSPFEPRSQNWRWYDDELDETPTTTLAAEGVAPSDVPTGNVLKLRVTVAETKNIARDDARFRLQYSEYSDFRDAADVLSQAACTGSSTWCYANGGGADNAVITTGTLSDADACALSVGTGCGTHNESPDAALGFTHPAGASVEYEFTVKAVAPRVNSTYFFRLYDVDADAPVPVNAGESYPSLATEGAKLVFTMTGLAASAVVEGVTLDVTTTPTTIDFGTLPRGQLIEGAHRLTVDANGTEGYKLYMLMTGDLTTTSGATIKEVTGTNGAPLSWNGGCAADAPSCFGYHTSDDTLADGSTRFSAIDTYARLSTTTPEEVAYSSQPVAGDFTDIVYRILVRGLQDAGNYETNIMYISVPVF
ncbi:MAG TPA: hypothetical protein VFS75_02410, partial [Candidatus Paceibacterota bacterium]|nr:hypothetical protein [Candidatus Paceibacterota bacterium]